MLGVSIEILRTVVSSTSVLRSFFSVASTTPLVALIPSEVAPPATAVSAYSICTSLPLGLKVVRLKEYCARGAGALSSSPRHESLYRLQGAEAAGAGTGIARTADSPIGPARMRPEELLQVWQQRHRSNAEFTGVLKDGAPGNTTNRARSRSL